MSILNINEIQGSTAVSGQEVYSTEETRIGTWIDGKPLYRICFLGTTPPSTKNYLKIHDWPQEKEAKNIFGAYISQGDTTPLPFTYESYAALVITNKTGVMMMVSHSTYTNCPMWLTIDYTKTTDEPTVQLDAQPLQLSADMSVPSAMPVTVGVVELFNEEV